MKETVDDNPAFEAGASSETDSADNADQLDGEFAVAEKERSALGPLRWPDAGEELPGMRSFDAPALNFFHRTGIRPGQEAESFHKPELHPAVIRPYLIEDRFRSPWPLLFALSNAKTVVRSLTEVVDLAISGLQAEGDDLEIQKRALYQLEHRIRDLAESQGVVQIEESLQDIAHVLLASVNGKKDRHEAFSKAFDVFKSCLFTNERVLPFGAASAKVLMEGIVSAETSRRVVGFREEIDWLAARLSDLLRVEEEDSAEGQGAERLEHTVGGAFLNEFDFASLSHLLEEAPHGPAMTEERRVRIWGILSELTETSDRLYGHSATRDTDTIETAIEWANENKDLFTRLVRAVHMARLEVENRYRPQRHDHVFEAYSAASIDADLLRMRPPVIVHLDSTQESGEWANVIQALGTAWPLRLLGTIHRVFDDDGRLAFESNLALSAVSLGNVFVEQCCLSDSMAYSAAVDAASSVAGSSFICVFSGADDTHPGLSRYMRSAIAGDTRAFPSFRYDPDTGSEWVHRFSATANEQPEADWPESEIDIEKENVVERHQIIVTAADFLASDQRFADDFLPIAQGSDVEALVPVEEYLNLSGDARLNKIPFILTVDNEGNLFQTVVSARVAQAVDAVRTKWRMVQEWSGEKSSIADRQVVSAKKELSDAYKIDLEEARNEFENKLSESTESIARQVVENIASGLLGLGPMPEGFSSTSAAIRAPFESRLPASSPAAEEEPSAAVQIAASEEEEQEEDDLAVSLDEAYIDTPLCTTCNECTDLNGVLFAYNENKQAYIKDIHAGTYRDLVMGAEKCPVKIIHPGKPLNLDEPELEEWIERAKPFR